MESGPSYAATVENHEDQETGWELGTGESYKEPWQPQGGTASPWAGLECLGPTK